jgi:hypothetical protein
MASIGRTRRASEADRFLAPIGSLPEPDRFDLDVVPTRWRRELLEQHQIQRPADRPRLGPAGWTCL